MTVADLIAALSEWPGDAQVTAFRSLHGKVGHVSGYEILRVTGFAGAHVSGRDSVVAIEYDEKAKG